MKKHNIPIGAKFGKWVVLDEAKTDKAYREFLVRCECGIVKQVPYANLSQGKSTSCKSCSITTHGESGEDRSRLYTVLANMKKRVKNDPLYKDIKLCKKWRKYENFRDWALANGYSDDLSIDRIDNAGNYKPSNCRWATAAVQAQNTRLIQKNNTSGYRGVTERGEKWKAQITHKSKVKYLGTYEFPEEAARAFDDYVIKHKLEQPLNFPEGIVCTDNVKDIVVDIDHGVYFIALANINKQGEEFGVSDEDGISDSSYKIPMKRYKKQFKQLIKEYVEAVEIESIAYDWKPGRVHLIFSDPKSNFRYDLYPKYKSGRFPDKPPLFYRIRKWAHKKYGYIENLEADDIVGYWARQGAVVITTDKDVYKGCPGLFYNSHHFHRCFIRTTEEEAYHFNLLQTIMGDGVDAIPGVPGVGKGMAEAFLYEDSWEAVVRAFKGIPPHKGKPFYNADGKMSAMLKKIQALELTEDDAILNHRLISLDQWTPKKGLQLWHP